MAVIKKRIANIVVALIIAGLAVWLLFYDKAAQPGGLSAVHKDISDCETCHIPWHGVREEMCLQCHEFSDVSDFDPRIRFHEAEKHCLECHTEHPGPDAGIAKVNHGIFNGDLLCTQCHMDRHEGLFGADCRQCHGIATWDIEGFQHPPAAKRNCDRCHRPPQFHKDTGYWAKIEKRYQAEFSERQAGSVSPQECWRCHITHKWSHLKMTVE